METSDLRKRVRATIEQNRRAAALRRERVDAATVAYDDLLEQTVVPLTRMLANVLRAEGYPFTVHTPKGGIRLASSASGDDFIELALDTQDEPVVVLRVTRTRGRRTLHHERPIRPGMPIDSIEEEDVVKAMLDELVPFVGR